MKPEYIICAAIYYNDGVKYPQQPKNIETGIVVSGLRHCNCYATISTLLGEEKYKKTNIGREGQGFITSLHRYVDRREGFRIAKANNQFIHRLFDEDDEGILTSEDLY